MTTARSWRDAVLDAIVRVASRRKTDVVNRRDIVAGELDRVVEETQSVGATPWQTLSRILQELRAEGLVEFLGQGRYRLVRWPINAEESDFTDTELDSAIESRLLRIGLVETGEKVSEARRRRGQQRVRVLTLANYHSQCALCDVDDSALLVASHVQPWAVAPDARGDLSNTLCLCRFHDPLFELGYWSLTDNGIVLINNRSKSLTIQRLLPNELTFRRPARYAPAQQYLVAHRRVHGFEDQGMTDVSGFDDAYAAT